MEKDAFDKLDANLTDLDLGITEQDGPLGRFAKKLVTNVVEKCLKDKSGAAFFKLADTLMSFVPAESPRDLMEIINNGSFCNNSKALHQAYKCLDRILTDHPKHTDDVVGCLIKRSKQKVNDETTVKDAFFLCEKIQIQKPEYQQDLLNIKKDALKNLCINSPLKGLKVISSLVQDAYPTNDDLSVIYDGFLAVLSRSDLHKATYLPILDLLDECSKSGYNKGENATKLNDICRVIQEKNPQDQKRLEAIKNNISHDVTSAIETNSVMNTLQREEEDMSKISLMETLKSNDDQTKYPKELFEMGGGTKNEEDACEWRVLADSLSRGGDRGLIKILSKPQPDLLATGPIPPDGKIGSALNALASRPVYEKDMGKTQAQRMDRLFNAMNKQLQERYGEFLPKDVEVTQSNIMQLATDAKIKQTEKKGVAIHFMMDNGKIQAVQVSPTGHFSLPQGSPTPLGLSSGATNKTTGGTLYTISPQLATDAKIKQTEKEGSTLLLVMGNGKTQTVQVSASGSFSLPQGSPTPLGFSSGATNKTTGETHYYAKMDGAERVLIKQRNQLNDKDVRPGFMQVKDTIVANAMKSAMNAKKSI